MTRIGAAGFVLGFLVLGITGCSADDGSPAVVHEHGEEPSGVTTYAGTDVFELPLGEHSTFKAVDMDTDVALMLHGHVEDAQVLEPIVQRINEGQSYADIYKIVSGGDDVPEQVLALDRKYATPRQESTTLNSPTADAGGTGEPSVNGLNGQPSQSAPGFRPQSHANPAGDANWDWVADCTWFLSQSPNTCDKRWAATSVTWAFSGHIESQQHWAVLMAASHTYGTDVLAQQWNGSTWVNLLSQYIQPRHLVSLWYGSATSSKKWRRFYNTGRGGAYARTHTHIGHTIKVPTGGVAVTCFHTYLCTQP